MSTDPVTQAILARFPTAQILPADWKPSGTVVSGWHQINAPTFDVLAPAVVKAGWSCFPADARRPPRPRRRRRTCACLGRISEALAYARRDPVVVVLLPVPQRCRHPGDASGGTFAVDVDVVRQDLSVEESCGSPTGSSGRRRSAALAGPRASFYSSGRASLRKSGPTSASRPAAAVLSTRRRGEPGRGRDPGARQRVTFFGLHHKTGKYFTWLGKAPHFYGPEHALSSRGRRSTNSSMPATTAPIRPTVGPRHRRRRLDVRRGRRPSPADRRRARGMDGRGRQDHRRPQRLPVRAREGGGVCERGRRPRQAHRAQAAVRASSRPSSGPAPTSAASGRPRTSERDRERRRPLGLLARRARPIRAGRPALRSPSNGARARSSAPRRAPTTSRRSSRPSSSICATASTGRDSWSGARRSAVRATHVKAAKDPVRAAERALIDDEPSASRPPRPPPGRSARTRIGGSTACMSGRPSAGSGSSARAGSPSTPGPSASSAATPASERPRRSGAPWRGRSRPAAGWAIPSDSRCRATPTSRTRSRREGRPPGVGAQRRRGRRGGEKAGLKVVIFRGRLRTNLWVQAADPGVELGIGPGRAPVQVQGQQERARARIGSRVGRDFSARCMRPASTSARSPRSPTRTSCCSRAPISPWRHPPPLRRP